MAHITKHGMKRIQERCGMSKNKKECLKQMRKVIKYGIKHNEAKNELKRKMSKIYLNHGNSNNARFYGNMVYIFADTMPGRERLITVYPISEKICQNLKQNVTEEAYERYQQRKNKYRGCSRRKKHDS